MGSFLLCSSARFLLLSVSNSITDGSGFSNATRSYLFELSKSTGVEATYDKVLNSAAEDEADSVDEDFMCA